MSIDLRYGDSQFENRVKDFTELIEREFYLSPSTSLLFARAIYTVCPTGEFPRESYKFGAWWESSKEMFLQYPGNELQVIKIVIELLQKIIKE